ncbi:MAG: hypothetical protein ACP5JH_07200 [Bacteroidota bacterium]
MRNSMQVTHEVDEEIKFAVGLLARICMERGDRKRLSAVFALLPVDSLERKIEAVGKLLELTESLVRVLRSEQMEVLYPFENLKIASRTFGMLFLEGYFDWHAVSDDPYEILGRIETMLEKLGSARASLMKASERLRTEVAHGVERLQG